VNPQEARERAEQEAADQAEERRVAREDARWKAEALSGPWRVQDPPMPPYLFADERSQRRVEEEARHERPLDDYAAWTDQNEQLFR
jgi:hypothetical protein